MLVDTVLITTSVGKLVNIACLCCRGGTQEAREDIAYFPGGNSTVQIFLRVSLE
jgi:hypothetical protein